MPHRYLQELVISKKWHDGTRMKGKTKEYAFDKPTALQKTWDFMSKLKTCVGDD